LLPHLFQFTDEHRAEGLELQRDAKEFETELKAALDEIWARPAAPGEDEEVEPVDGWAARMAEIERNKAINPIDKVPKPDVSQVRDWQVNLLGL
jgi:elongator complex protein 1